MDELKKASAVAQATAPAARSFVAQNMNPALAGINPLTYGNGQPQPPIGAVQPTEQPQQNEQQVQTQQPVSTPESKGYITPQEAFISEGRKPSKELFEYTKAYVRAKQGKSLATDTQILDKYNGIKTDETGNTFAGIDTVNQSPEQIGEQLKSQNPGHYAFLESIKDGKYKVSGRSSKEMNKVVEQVQTIWPGTDLQALQARYDVRKDFTSGPTSKNIDSLNTAINHAGVALPQIEALGNSGLKIGNKFGNFLKEQAGDPRVSVLNSTLSLLNRETNKAIASGVVTNEDKQTFENNLSSAQNAEVAKEVVKNYIHLLAGRTQPLLEKWKTVYGQDSNFDVIRNSAQKVLSKNGFQYDPNTGDIVDGGNSGGGSYKSGETRVVNGVTYTRDEKGQWSSQ